MEKRCILASSEHLSFNEQVKRLTWPFWVANIMEMFERLSYYGVRVVIPIYIAQADAVGGLHFSHSDKGLIFMAWALVQSILPIFTGGFADRYGYKRQIVMAVALDVAGYVMMATQREFWPFFAGCMLVAAGTAVFKPPVQATFVKSMDEKATGVGWGFFYQIVNIGGFLGPPVAHFFLGIGWPMVFYGSAALMCVNLLWLVTYKNVESGADKSTGMMHVIKETAANILNYRLVFFILIISGFWACFTQLFDMLPNFIVDWVDSSSIAAFLPDAMLSYGDSRGTPQITQEWVINLNSFLIILFVVHISWFVNERMRRLSSIFWGIIASSLGVFVISTGQSIWLCFLGISIFSVGEMLSSPKMNEYLGVIAPKDKKALFMGYANMPLAIGWGYGAFLGGQVYDENGDKAVLALKYLAEELKMQDLPERSLAFKVLVTELGQSATEVTNLLWDKYNPGQVWYPFVALGLFSAMCLLVYNRLSRKWGDYDA